MPNPQNLAKHQFKKGQTGNPKGRPKKLPQLDILMAEVMGREEGGVTIAQKILEALEKQALKGDVKAAQLLMDRGWGKPKENEGQPTEMVIRVQRNS